MTKHTARLRRLSDIRACAGSAKPAFAALGLALLAVTLPQATVAQTQTQVQPQPAPQTAPQGTVTETKVFGDWIFRCTNTPPPPASPLQPGQQEACFITQQVLNQSNQRLVLKITIGYFEPGRQPGAILAFPLGVPLASGVKVVVDGKNIQTIPFQVCLPDSCQAFLPMSEDVVGAFKAGNQGVLQITPGASEPINVPFSLKGFTAGYGSIK